MAPTRFELVSSDSKSEMLVHYTTGLMVLGRFELPSAGSEPAMLGQLHYRTTWIDLIPCRYNIISHHEIQYFRVYIRGSFDPLKPCV